VPDLHPVYDELLRRLSVHEDAFAAKGEKDSYVLLGAPTEKYPDGQMFAWLRLGKRYVSYYLMSVYAEPAALEEMSPALRRRMQGKSCFNFTRVDDQLFDELDQLTRRGREQYDAAGLLRG
jgi:hypothetical protein